VLSIAGILVVVGAVIGKGAKPYLVGYTENREIAQINRQIARETALRKDLNKQIEYVQTPAGMESEARKLGWVKEGEVAVVVDDTKKEPTPEKASDSTFLQRIGKGITGLFSFTKG
jgi:cell division protein FtsL